MRELAIAGFCAIATVPAGAEDWIEVRTSHFMEN